MGKYFNTVPALKNISTIYDQISISLENDNVNYKKYGGKTMTTLILLNHQFFGSATIDVKHNKYRVTINNIYFVDEWSLASETTKNNSTKLSEIALKKNGQLKKLKPF